MNEKKFTLWILGIILITPLILFSFNRFVVSWLDPLPKGIRDVDVPLYSNMYLTPNYNGVSYRFNIHRGAKHIHFSSNSLGLRSPELTEDKDLILFSGDSTLFGSNLNDEETVPQLLQNLFNHKYEFINAGIPGKAIPHNLLTLKDFVKKTQGDPKIKIRYFVNWIKEGDFEFPRDLQDVQMRAEKNNLSFKRKMMVRFPMLTSLATTLINPDRLFPIRHSFKNFFVDKKNFRFQSTENETIQQLQVDSIFERNLEYFREMTQICNDHHIRMINVIATSGYQDIVYPDSYSDQLESVLINAGVTKIIKLKDIYNSNPELLPSIAYWDNDFDHFTLPAAREIARHLYNFFKQDGLKE
ncbi:MAG: hypothetical protein G3M78_01085 [Candidatus Nitrohelix vancouverensis]|uniref:SGNH/GDSL hydrolase family protein n=1 Tax=Candidatus Nitrohelix vancouverensis TaxID=2705534 RepID=A0A7T0C061_9BACT|nr:MAG: hypothetical protein G3M78_01085 [Candidatus Nitrohelix vancouverensis]